MADVPDGGIQSLIEWARGERAALVITFADIKDSTRLADELGDEKMREVQEARFGQSTSLIAANGGRRIKGLGDGDMAAFQNVEAALDYALALQTDPGHRLLDSRLRAGIHIGPVTVTADDVYGNTVNFASRVGSATKAAEIWLSEDALRHLVTLRAARHGELRWQDHPAATIAGLGAYALWSLSASGRTLAELAAEFRRARIPAAKVAETNIPAGMVPRVFRGRDDDLAAIEAALQGGDKPVLVTAPSVTALHGLRGVGKSVLAARYAELHDAHYRAAWWIRSETEAGLRADLAGLAVRLGWAAADATEEEAIAQAREKLRQQGGGILVIFDNARDAAALRPYLPQGGDAKLPSGAEAAAAYLMNELALYKEDVLAAYAQAEPLYRRALAIGETALGPRHPNVASRLNNLAGLLRATGRAGEAEPLYRRALAITEPTLGPDHPAVATDLNNLAGLLRATGRAGEAEPLYRRSLAIVETALGADHPAVPSCLNNLAGLLYDTGRVGEAEPLYRRALAILEASLGPEHPNTVTVRQNLAVLLAGR